MRVYIQTDLEGIAGLVFFENRRDDRQEGFHHRQRMRRLLTGEVNAAVVGAFAAGASEVVVNDSHGSGYNLIFEELDPRCEIIHGRNCSGPHWLPLLDAAWDALVLVGMHAMGGTEDAITPHSRWVVNGGEVLLSEATMAAAIAGDHGVPTVFASGDDKLVAEVTGKIAGIATVVTKQALGAYQARSLIPGRACTLIRERVQDGLTRRADIAPYRLAGPVRLQLLDSAGHVPPLTPALPAEVGGATINEAFMAYERAMDWTCFDTHLPDGHQFP